MAVASRLEVDLKNEVWSGDLLMDVRRMYHRIIFRIMQFLIETSGGSPLLAVNIVRSTLANTRLYLATSTTRSVERDIAITARKHGISYTREAMIEDEVTMLSGPQGPMTDDVRATRMKTGPKSAFKLKMTWGKKSAKGRCKEESEWAEVCETDSCSVSEGAASDSGVSIGESDSEDEKGWDEEEVGVAF
ncbi:hypothetical protein OPQ81_010506 [Rhizoctonia solani]|nr:hypothetical protein OPQ81_010506 [Rhizoctonia solani]